MEGQAEAKARVTAKREERRRASLYPAMLKALKEAYAAIEREADHTDGLGDNLLCSLYDLETAIMHAEED